MIQRMQSIYLFLAFLTILTLFLEPQFAFFYTYATDPDTYISIKDNFLMTGLTVLIALLSFISIFLYKNRVMQLRICWTAIILDLILITIAGYYYYLEQIKPSELHVEFLLGSIVPFITLIFLFMAKRGVRKDELLVRSLDRLR